jgi:hypothetical protein
MNVEAEIGKTAVRPPADVWKWVCGILTALLIGTWSGQFMPNRDVVTRGDIAPLAAEIAGQTQEIASLKDEVSGMKGQLVAQKLITGAP